MDKYNLSNKATIEAGRKYNFAKEIRLLLNDKVIKELLIENINEIWIYNLDVSAFMEPFNDVNLEGYEENLRDLEEEWFSEGYIIDWKRIHLDKSILFMLNL